MEKASYPSRDINFEFVIKGRENIQNQRKISLMPISKIKISFMPMSKIKFKISHTRLRYPLYRVIPMYIYSKKRNEIYTFFSRDKGGISFLLILSQDQIWLDRFVRTIWLGLNSQTTTWTFGTFGGRGDEIRMRGELSVDDICGSFGG